jgi:purine-binding chemotaxis protein CheW
MESKPYLIFYLDKSPYAIAAPTVKEIFPLPELIPLPEAPTDIIGVLNLRGAILPIMHLGLRLGRSSITCQLSDQVVVLNLQGLQIGMVVDLVQDLQTIDQNLIQIQPDYGRSLQPNPINPAFIAGIAKIESELIVILNPETLIRQPAQVTAISWEQTEGNMARSAVLEPSLLDLDNNLEADQIFLEERIADEDPDLGLDQLFANLKAADLKQEISTESQIETDQTPAQIGFGDFYDRFLPGISPADRDVLLRRAENLRLPLVDLNDATGLFPMAIVKLGGESFGIDLSVIQEFTSIRNLTRIPCCPNHIVGNMNLRGEIITLVDIRHILNLSGAPVKIGSKTIVVQVQDILAGLPVDDVADVTYINPQQIKPLPIALPASSEAYLQGTVSVFDLTLGILDLPKILTGKELIVNETV